MVWYVYKSWVGILHLLKPHYTVEETLPPRGRKCTFDAFYGPSSVRLEALEG